MGLDEYQTNTRRTQDEVRRTVTKEQSPLFLFSHCCFFLLLSLSLSSLFARMLSLSLRLQKVTMKAVIGRERLNLCVASILCSISHFASLAHTLLPALPLLLTLLKTGLLIELPSMVVSAVVFFVVVLRFFASITLPFSLFVSFSSLVSTEYSSQTKKSLGEAYLVDMYQGQQLAKGLRMSILSLLLCSCCCCW